MIYFNSNGQFQTPIEIAVLAGFSEIVQSLLEYGISASTVNNSKVADETYFTF